jgi:hypothetical protein
MRRRQREQQEVQGIERNLFRTAAQKSSLDVPQSNDAEKRFSSFLAFSRGACWP